MDELLERSAVELTRMIRHRQVSSRELVEAHLRRIDEVNPVINAVITLDPEGAMAAARRADEVTAAGGEMGVLHGLPMTHKDTHRTRACARPRVR